MSEVVGEAVYKIRTDESGVDFDGAGQRAGTAYGKGFGRTAAKLATGFLVGAVGTKAVQLIGDSIAAASDLAESTNKVEQIFGTATDSVLKFTSTTADNLGQTNTQAREAASTFGIFGKSAGFADKENARFAKRFTTLASDLASFNNTSPEQAIDAIGAALRGEAEPIRAYGVLLDEATLKAEAMRLGLLKPVKDQSKILSYQVRITKGQQDYNEAVKKYGKDSLEALTAEANLGTLRTSLQKATEGTIPPLTQQQKLLAAQSEILKQTTVAQGDFARTSGGLANEQRRLSASVEDAKAKLGEAFLPVAQEVVGFLIDKGVPALEDFSGWFKDKGVPAISDFIDEARPVAEKWLPKIIDGLGTARDVAEDAAGFLGTLLDGFDNLPDGLQKILIGGGVTALGAKKLGLFDFLGGGKGGPLGAVTSSPLLQRGSKTNPMYVIDLSGGLGNGIGVPDGGRDKNDPNGRRPRRVPRGTTAGDLALLFGIPIIADAAVDALGWDEVTEKQHKQQERFLAKWGDDVAAQSAKARDGLAKAFNIDLSPNLLEGLNFGDLTGDRGGKGKGFGGIPGTDFFNSGDRVKQLEQAIQDATSSQLIDINADLKETFGVGIPRLVKDGFLDADARVAFQVAKQQESVIRSAREMVQGFRAGIEGDYTGRFTLLGIDKANLQINGMFDLFMARNRRLQDQFPAGGEGSPQPPNHQPGGDDTLLPAGRRQQAGEATVTIQHAHFHDWNDMQKQTRTHRRLAAIGGRRVGQEVPA